MGQLQVVDASGASHVIKGLLCPPFCLVYVMHSYL